MYLLDKGMKIIPSSKTPNHQKENLDVLKTGVVLTSQDIKNLDSIGVNNGRCKDNLAYFND
jgi:diketogulonate reductase-like aldo/keto reductase